ncbi:MAG: type II secretion system F family protein [Hydrogenophaga sp.]|uniref:type II secretion system F family protein n=1 Tax=Hydrogenophaga sp. TaxID=1904254 RepID=UPI0027187D1C|nr:type II secretion system F family protein [Hydrogenophaga sp.]MDO9031476.1 type II secretion system F family protein [Hydrogenophaga sp.]
MTAFAWKGRNNRGEMMSGVVDATTDGAVADQLFANGITPVEVKHAGAVPLSASASVNQPDWLKALTEVPVKELDILVLSRQMYTLQKAGVPILRALAGLESSHEKPAMVALLADVRASLDQGKDLSAAFSRHPKHFSGFYLAMVRVGEMTGHLADVFLRLSEHMEFDLDTRARIKQALRYPTMVLSAIAIAIVLINIFVIPTFATVFAGFKAELPIMTKGLLAFSAFMVAYWPGMLVAAVGAFFGIRTYIATPEGRYRWDRQKLRLPFVGNIILKATLSRFARSFALSSRAGVPITQSLTVVALTVDNAFIASRIDQMLVGVERGESISRCATAAGVFTPIVLQMIAVGEETGELDTLLVEVAQMYERETDYAIKGLSSAIEPILLCVVGALVLMLALGVFLPLWSLGQAAMGKG